MDDDERDERTRALSIALAQTGMLNGGLLDLCHLSMLQAMVMASMNVCAHIGRTDEEAHRDMDEALATVRAQLLLERQRQAATHEAPPSVN